MQVRKERTGWRDLGLSERHRVWGWDLPAVDLDFLFLEYDKGKAVALVEYKHEKAPMQNSGHPTYQAMADLANRAEIPFFGSRYKRDFSEFIVTPLNSFCAAHLGVRMSMTEAEWVTFLYRVRGREIPADVMEALLAVEL